MEYKVNIVVKNSHGIDEGIKVGKMENKFEILEVPIERIHPSKDNPRKDFDDKRIEDLSLSMKEQGLIIEISIRKDDATTFEIIDGERRWRAANLLKWKTIRCKVYGITPLEAQLIRLTVLLSSEDVKERQKEDAVYQTYKGGVLAELFKSRKTERDTKTKYPGSTILATLIGADQSRVSQYLTAAEERSSFKTTSIVQKASVTQLMYTRILPQDMREKVLEYVVGKGIGQNPLSEIVKVIKETPDEFKTEIATEIIRRELDPLTAMEIAQTVKEVPDDLKAVVIKGIIEPERAKVIAELQDPKQRQKFVDEEVLIKQDQEDEQRHHELEIKVAVEAERRGQKPPKTSMEIKEENRKVEFDNYLSDRFYGIHLDALAAIKASNIEKVHDDTKRAKCLWYIEDIVRICNEVLNKSRGYPEGTYIEVIEDA